MNGPKTSTLGIYPETRARLDALRASLRDLGSAAVAFSAGVDSTFLLRVAHDVLGDRVVAVTVRAPFVPPREVDEGVSFCRQIGVRHVVLDANLADIPMFAENPPDRCYHCKKAIFSRLVELARSRGLAAVLEGSNLDDDGDYRPGRRAIRELGVRSPLHDAGLTKPEIRALSRDMGLPTADKPSFACLASRFPYGERITAEGLDRVGRAEEWLREHVPGLAQLRVRCHGGSLARIEVPSADIPRLAARAADISAALRGLGFAQMEIDPRGYRTGSLNESLHGADEPLDAILRRASAAPMALSRAELVRLLSLEDPAERAALHAAALAVKRRVTGPVVSLRGLVEIGNACSKDCLYCGLRRSNAAVRRYRIPEEDVVRMARWAFDRRFGSVVLQSGEIESDENTERILRILRAIRDFGGDDFAVVLSLGEQREEVYRAWREAGAARYLLRIETSNPALYATLHPAGHSWERRRDCLRALRRLGYQVGSGVMIGLPGQTADDLAGDIGFFADEDIDMIGMGPFLPHGETPLGAVAVDRARQLRLGIDMVAATRLQLHDRNIAATTVLQVLAPDGREQALLAGANVMMPNVTDVSFRRDYRLYEDKPCTEDTSDQCLGCIERRVASVGERIWWGAPGTSPHYLGRAVTRATARIVDERDGQDKRDERPRCP